MKSLIALIFCFVTSLHADPVREPAWSGTDWPPLSVSETLTEELQVIDFDETKCTPLEFDKKQRHVTAVSCPVVTTLEKGTTIVRTHKQAQIRLKGPHKRWIDARSWFLADEIIYSNSRGEPTIGFVMTSNQQANQ